MTKLTKFDMCLAGETLQAIVTEDGIILDPDTKKPIGKCKAPEFTQKGDCVYIDIKAQAYKPIESIECSIVFDEEKEK